MIIREVRTFLGPKNVKIEEYVATNVDTGVAIAVENQANGILEADKSPPSVFLGVRMVPGAVVNDKGELIGVSPQEIRFPIPAKTRNEAILGFEKGFEAFMRNMEERERQQQKDIVVPDEQLTQAINESSKKLKIVTE